MTVTESTTDHRGPATGIDAAGAGSETVVATDSSRPSSWSRSSWSRRSPSTGCAASTRRVRSHDHYRLSPRVGLRPEPFGALAYHFDTRRLVFLKSPDLVDLVHSLDAHPSADAAIDAVVAPSPQRREAYVRALARCASRASSNARRGATCRDQHAAARRAAQGRPRRPDLPHLGAHLRLQPGLRPLPVELGPARPTRADHGRGAARSSTSSPTSRSST